MLNELLTIFRPGNPLKKMADEFSEMLGLTCDMTLTAGKIYFDEEVDPDARTTIYKNDVRVNQLERSIRKRVAAHLSVASNTPRLPYCLLLMSLVKDVERVGDYAKNISEVPGFCKGKLPKNGVLAELRQIRDGVEEAFKEAAEVFVESDRERAMPLIMLSKEIAQRSDRLLMEIAQSDNEAGATTAFVLGVRYYKRIGGHVLNVLSSVVMPLHKIDYYDEDELPNDLT